MLEQNLLIDNAKKVTMLRPTLNFLTNNFSKSWSELVSCAEYCLIDLPFFQVPPSKVQRVPPSRTTECNFSSNPSTFPLNNNPRTL